MTKLILASQSPRRRQLLAEAGYTFDVMPASESAECGICSKETPPEMVARLAYQKAADVARTLTAGLVLGSDTVAECVGQILGKPKNRQHAGEMLRLQCGRSQRVYSGVCLWLRPDDRTAVDVDCTELKMADLSDEQIEEYLDSGLWEGKAGAFGLQDRTGWVSVVRGSESNVVGLPLEMLERMLQEFDA